VLIIEGTHGMRFEEDEEMEEVEVQCDVPFHQLERGEFNIIYAHPEIFGSLLRCNTYQDNVCAVVIDEVHILKYACIKILFITVATGMIFLNITFPPVHSDGYFGVDGLCQIKCR
jgi:hypothetical protein